MNFNGERVVWADMKSSQNNAFVLCQHLYRYVYSLHYTYGKTALDASAGTCYGSFLLSMVAREVICADISAEALEEGKKLPFASKVRYNIADFNKDMLPKADTCVSFETIEHLENAPFFLENLKVKELIYSVPINHPNDYHKLVFNDKEAILSFLAAHGWTTFEYFIQGDEKVEGFVVGRAKRLAKNDGQKV